MTIELDESERQMLLLALARLALERPGWDDALNRIAMRIDNRSDGRAVSFDAYKRLTKRPREGERDGAGEQHERQVDAMHRPKR